ncbi:MAG: hypothetical protein AAGE05_01775 [Pseudomonadota bacterium]
MPADRTDRALRRMVARLADAPADDRRAILDALAADERTRIEALIEEYRGAPASSREADMEGNRETAHALDRYSPWLRARILSEDGAPEEGRERGFRITPLAARTVRELVAAAPENRPAAGGEDGHGASLFERLTANIPGLGTKS